MSRCDLQDTGQSKANKLVGGVVNRGWSVPLSKGLLVPQGPWATENKVSFEINPCNLYLRVNNIKMDSRPTPDLLSLLFN